MTWVFLHSFMEIVGFSPKRIDPPLDHMGIERLLPLLQADKRDLLFEK
jgi:hypothetical protein